MQQLASAIGVKRVEQEVVSQVALLAESRAKERKAVSAHICGVLTGYVSAPRCRSLLETLKRVRVCLGADVCACACECVGVCCPLCNRPYG